MDRPAPKKNKRAGVTAAAAEDARSKVGIVIETPTNWCTRIAHPFGGCDADRHHISRNMIHVVELFLPAVMYKSQPTNMLPDNQNADMLLVYHQIFNVFGFLANTVHAKRKKVSDDNPKEVQMSDSPNYVVLTFEVVMSPHKTTVGYRVRLTEMCHDADGNTGILGALAGLLASNDERIVSGLKGKGKPVFGKAAATGATSHQLVTTPEWQKMCMVYGGPGLMRSLISSNESGEGSDNTTSPKCVFNIENVFSIERSLELARSLGAAPEYCDLGTYTSNGVGQHATGSSYQLYDFPHPENVYELAPTDLMPSKLPRLYSPMRCPDPKLNKQARKMYTDMHGPGAGAFFDAACVRTSASQEAFDVKWLTNEVKLARADLEAKWGSDERNFFCEWRVIQREMNHRMGEIFHPQGDVAPAARALAAFRDSWLEENDNTLCMERAQNVSGLTRFQDQMAELIALFETVATVKESHKHCVRALFSALSVWRRRDDNPHGLELGFSGAGKSFMMKLITLLLLEGTWLNLLDLTNRSITYSKNQFDCLVLIIEDAQASLLGVQSANKTKSGVSTDKENMIKQFLTQIQMSLLTVETEPKLHSTMVKADCCCVCIFAMNEPTSVFSDAMLNRFNVTVWPEQREREGPSNIDRNMRGSQAAIKSANNTLRVYWNRTQLLVAEVTYRIAAGIIQEVNMDAAATVFGLIASQMKMKYGSNEMQDQRRFNRFKAIVTVQVVLAAIDLVWDSPLSPVRGQPHHNDHFLLVEKHLVATVSHAVFAIGLLSGQWQDDVRVDVISTMKKMWFPHADEKIRNNISGVDGDQFENVRPAPVAPGRFSRLPDLHSGRPLTEQEKKNEQLDEVIQYRAEQAAYDGFREQTDQWMYDSVLMPSPNFSAPTRPNPSKVEMADHIASQLQLHLAKRPILSEVAAVVLKLMNETDTVHRRVLTAGGYQETSDTRENVVTLSYTSDRLRMSLGILSRASQSDMLFHATRDVLQMLVNTGAYGGKILCLYGETEPLTPYVWKSIRVKRNANVDPAEAKRARSIMRVQSANYFDQALVDITCSFMRTVEPSMDRKRMKCLFKSDTPWVNIDADLDAYAVEEHSRALGLNPSVQAHEPSNVPSVTEKKLAVIRDQVRAAAGKPKLVYPECFARRDIGSWTDTWEVKEHHPDTRDAFQASSRMNKSFEYRAENFTDELAVPSIGHLHLSPQAEADLLEARLSDGMDEDALQDMDIEYN